MSYHSAKTAMHDFWQEYMPTYDTDMRSRQALYPNLPLLNFRSILLSTLVLGTTQITLAAIVKRRGTLPLAKTILKVHANIYSWLSFSLILTSLIPERNWPAFVLQILQKLGVPADSGLLYHYSKFYEYADVILVTLMGREMDWHWGIHHPTTPYWTYARCILHPDGGTWRLFAALNALHHWLMYATFAGHSFVRPMLLYTGLFQLSVGVLMETFRGIGEYSYNYNAGYWKLHSFAGGLLAMYLGFFIRMIYQRPPPAKAQEKE